MTRRLLHDPHLLAHELRTPLSVLAGWYSLMRDGDIGPQSPQWKCATEACEQAVDRLNLVISTACNEAERERQLHGDQMERMLVLMDATRRAIDESERVLDAIRRRRPPQAEEPKKAERRSQAASSTTASGGLRSSGYASKSSP